VPHHAVYISAPVRSRRTIRLAIVALTVGVLSVAAGSCSDDSAQSQPRRAATPPPVVVLILDEFPLDDLLMPDGSIDAERFPSFAALARTSTWFPNAHTVYDSTFKAVPSILDARLPQRGSAPDVRSHHHSIYTLFGERGYGVVDAESATAICPRSVCAGARTRRPGVLARLAGGGRAARLHHWLGQIRQRAQPTLYLQHALMPHEPWIYLPSGRRSRPTGNDPIPGINRPEGFDDPDLSLHNHQRHLLQVGFVDHQIGLLLARLRETGLLDEALVAVVADHGYAFDVGATDRRLVTERNVHEIGPVPFLLKRPGQNEGVVDPSLVRNMDLVPTLADVTGAHVDWRHDGISAFAPATQARRTVRISKRDFSGVVTIGAAELQRRRAAARARWAQLFGTGAQSQLLYGSPWASLYRIGPNAQLIGQRVGAAAKARESRGVHAGLANAELLRHVSTSNELLPTRVTGRLTGGKPSQLRDLAVAANGRIEAVGRSFRLRGQLRESYSLMLPEESLRPGRNELQLFEVGAGLRLTRLYGTL
jgi:hypothetical protein